MAIYGKIDDCASQIQAHAGFAAGFAFLKAVLGGTHPAAARLNEVAEGTPVRIDLLGPNGEQAYAQLQHARTKPRAEQQAESHRVYADIQAVVDGEERLEVMPLDGLETTLAYDASRDLILYKMPAEASRLVMRRGVVAVLYPTDAHAPLQAPDGVSRPSRRIVVKVKVGDP